MTGPTVLFVLWHPGQLRYFERAFELMATRGVRLHIALERPRERIPHQLDYVRRLAERYENVVLRSTGKRTASGWGAVATDLRLALDHLHYFHPRFDSAPDFRARAAKAAPRWVRPAARAHRWRRHLTRVLELLERAIPPGPVPARVLDEVRPDVVVVTPYVWFGAPQTDWTRVAHNRGVPVVGAMFSWDNLTSKGSLREQPDLMTVWNRSQVDEATVLHGVAPERIVVTGAQVWDLWFEWKPSRDRAAFCEALGLDPARKLILYLESSGYVGGEGAFAARWVEALRRSDDADVASAQILVRPHPQANSDDWEATGLTASPGIAVWPPTGQVVQDQEARANFFDSLFHADAVVGVNTSAFIETAIVGRPALTLMLPEFRKGQAGTVHFAYLLEQNGGPVRAASSMGEHVAQLARALSDPSELQSLAGRFTERFVRPHGRDEPATPRLVDTFERAAELSVDPQLAGDLRLLVPRIVLAPFAAARGTRPWLRNRLGDRAARQRRRKRRKGRRRKRWSRSLGRLRALATRAGTSGR